MSCSISFVPSSSAAFANRSEAGQGRTSIFRRSFLTTNLARAVGSARASLNPTLASGATLFVSDWRWKSASMTRTRVFECRPKCAARLMATVVLPSPGLEETTQTTFEPDSLCAILIVAQMLRRVWENREYGQFNAYSPVLKEACSSAPETSGRTAQGSPVAWVTCWEVLKTPNGKFLANTKAAPKSNPITDPPTRISHRFFEDSVCEGGLARMRTRKSGVNAGCASSRFIWLNCCSA